MLQKLWPFNEHSSLNIPSSFQQKTLNK